MKKLIITLAIVLVSNFSQANTIVVNNLNDSGPGSLRDAASTAADLDTIRFNPNLLTAAVDSISLVTEIAFASKSIVIKGLYTATDTLFISGANTSRIFSFHICQNVVLDSLVLINGNGVGAFSSASGGAVMYFEGTSSSVNGTNKKLHILNSVIRNNTADFGGGICARSQYNAVKVNIVNSTISNNYADSQGGGVYLYCPAQYNYLTLNVSSSTIANNDCLFGGGGIRSTSKLASTITIDKSTFYNNTGESLRFIVLNTYAVSSATITNSTFYNTNTFGGITFGFNSSSSSTVTYSSSILFDNTISTPSTITSNGYNIFSGTQAGSVATDQTSITSAQLNLTTLAINGGTTPTLLPGVNSVAINLGDINDLSDAQNRSVSEGRRDVGAAETVCLTTSGVYNETVCFGDSIIVNGTVYKAGHLSGTEVFSNVGVNNCDSLVTVTLTIENQIDLSTTINGLTLSANQTGATYQWIDCNNSNLPIAGETNSTYTATTNGNYAVIVTVGNCSDTSACVTINNVGVNESNSTFFTLYPNPATDKFTINSNQNIKSIVIYTIEGQIVMEENNTNSITISHLSKGIYFVKINTENGNSVIKKLVKE